MGLLDPGMLASPDVALAIGLLGGHGNFGANLGQGLLGAMSQQQSNLERQRLAQQNKMLDIQTQIAQQTLDREKARAAALQGAFSNGPGLPATPPTAPLVAPPSPSVVANPSYGPMASAMTPASASSAPALSAPQGGIPAAQADPRAQMRNLYYRTAQSLAQQGFGDDAQKYFDMAIKLEDEFNPTPVTMMENGKPTQVLISKQGKTKDLAGYAPKPDFKEVNTGNRVGFVDPLTGQQGPSFGVNVSPNTAYERQTQFAVAGLDPNGQPSADVNQVAQAIADGKMPPLSAFALARPRGQQIMSRVYELNPNYDATEYAAKNKATSAFATGKQGDTVRFIGVALSHGDQLAQAVQALNNGNIPLFNQIGNAFAQATGQPAPTNFDAVKNIYKDEVTKAILGGAGALGDREAVAKTIDKANSPKQLYGVMQQYQGLLRGQLGGLKQQYEQTTGRNDFSRFLSPAAKNLEQGGSGKLQRNADGSYTYTP